MFIIVSELLTVIVNSKKDLVWKIQYKIYKFYILCRNHDGNVTNNNRLLRIF